VRGILQRYRTSQYYPYIYPYPHATTNDTRRLDTTPNTHDMRCWAISDDEHQPGEENSKTTGTVALLEHNSDSGGEVTRSWSGDAFLVRSIRHLECGRSVCEFSIHAEPKQLSSLARSQRPSCHSCATSSTQVTVTASYALYDEQRERC
jgi:hypothetical protein